MIGEKRCKTIADDPVFSEITFSLVMLIKWKIIFAVE